MQFSDFYAEEVTRALARLTSVERKAVAHAGLRIARDRDTPDALSRLWEALAHDALDAEALFQDSWERLLDAWDWDAGQYDEP